MSTWPHFVWGLGDARFSFLITCVATAHNKLEMLLKFGCYPNFFQLDCCIGKKHSYTVQCIGCCWLLKTQQGVSVLLTSFCYKVYFIVYLSRCLSIFLKSALNRRDAVVWGGRGKHTLLMLSVILSAVCWVEWLTKLTVLILAHVLMHLKSLTLPLERL